MKKKIYKRRDTNDDESGTRRVYTSIHVCKYNNNGRINIINVINVNISVRYAYENSDDLTSSTYIYKIIYPT